MDDTQNSNQEPRDPEELAQELLELTTEFKSEFAKEIAATGDRPVRLRSSYNLSLAKVSELVSLSSEIIMLLHQRTNSGGEARFVASYVKAAVDHWQSAEARESRERS